MTRVLLDTNAWLRWTSGTGKLSKKARELILDPVNDVHFSVASAWEIAIKHGRGRLPLPQPPTQFVMRWLGQQGFTILPILIGHVGIVGELPLHHRDPFDRLLVAQAIVERMVLVSTDAEFSKYDVELVRA